MPGLTTTNTLADVSRELITGSVSPQQTALANRFFEGGGIRTADDVGNITDKAQAEAAELFDTTPGLIDRQTRAVGTNISGRRQGGRDRRIGLGRALAQVDASNRALNADQTQRRTIRQVGSSLRDIFSGQQLSALQGAGRAEAGRHAEFNQRMARFEANRQSGLSGILQLGGTFAGGVLGGPLGGSIGGSLGSMVGGLV